MNPKKWKKTEFVDRPFWLFDSDRILLKSKSALGQNKRDIYERAFRAAELASCPDSNDPPSPLIPKIAFVFHYGKIYSAKLKVYCKIFL